MQPGPLQFWKDYKQVSSHESSASWRAGMFDTEMWSEFDWRSASGERWCRIIESKRVERGKEREKKGINSMAQEDKKWETDEGNIKLI